MLGILVPTTHLALHVPSGPYFRETGHSVEFSFQKYGVKEERRPNQKNLVIHNYRWKMLLKALRNLCGSPKQKGLLSHSMGLTVVSEASEPIGGS